MGPTALLSLRRKCALRIFITHKNPLSSAGPENATAGTVGETSINIYRILLRYIPEDKQTPSYIYDLFNDFLVAQTWSRIVER
jgi:hypothetical protein